VAETDDRGVYRLAGLTPGRYLIRTAAKQLEGGHALLPTYYGQTTSAGDARSVQVELDREVTGVNIAPAPGRLATVRGTVIGGGAASVLLLADTGPRNARLRPGGGFRFDQVAPGAYVLLVNPAPGSERAAYSEVFVSGEEVNVVLEMQPAPSLRVRCQGATGAAIDPAAVSIFLRRKQFGETSARISCGEKAVWSPGPWQVAVATPPQFYVASILEAGGGEDAHEFTLKPGEPTEITVLLGSRPAVLQGRVLTPDEAPVVGAPVFLNAYDSELRRRLGGLRTARADHNGEYRFTGLPPGRYEVLSSYQIQNPQQAWAPGLGAAVTLEEGAQQTLNLSLTELE
jgi:hypothetical protein